MLARSELAAAARAVLPAATQAWFVGGAVRDELLGRSSVDIDMAVAGDVEGLARRLADHLAGAVYEASAEYGAWRVIVGDQHLDLVRLRFRSGGNAGDSSLTGDLRARDFTVNALARSLDGELIDPLGGSADLAAGRLRLCTPEALADDPLRVMRLARLAAQLDLKPDGAALSAARSAGPALAAASGERRRDELVALLSTPAKAPAALRELAAWGALVILLPEVDALRGLEQNDYHHHDAFEHSLEALSFVAGVCAQLGGEQNLTPADEFGFEPRRALVPVALAVLLHDIGKPAAKAYADDGRLVFWNHDVIGAQMIDDVAARLRLSSRCAAFLATLVRQHLRLGFLVHEQPVSRRALARYRRAVTPWTFESVVVSLCDRLATRGEKTTPISLARHYSVARHVWQRVAKAPPPRLLGGAEVMALLGIEQGPRVGAALAALDEEVEIGALDNAEAARTFLRAWSRRRESGPPGESKEEADAGAS